LTDNFFDLINNWDNNGDQMGFSLATMDENLGNQRASLVDGFGTLGTNKVTLGHFEEVGFSVN
jgi:hypothetical protein